MEIKVLGSGCAKCDMLERAVRDAVARLGLDATVEHVTDFAEIMSFGVMMTPALVIDGAVRLAGRVPSAPEMDRVLTEAGSAGAEGDCSCGCDCC